MTPPAPANAIDESTKLKGMVDTKLEKMEAVEEAAAIPDVKVFHAGTTTQDGNIVTNGGRVLGVTALGSSISAAKLQAYTAVRCIRWPGAWCRKDISDKALQYAK